MIWLLAVVLAFGLAPMQAFAVAGDDVALPSEQGSVPEPSTAEDAAGAGDVDAGVADEADVAAAVKDAAKATYVEVVPAEEADAAVLAPEPEVVPDVFSDLSPFADTVYNESELRRAIDDAPANVPYTITISADIALGTLNPAYNAYLIIPGSKIIVFNGTGKIIAPGDYDAIVNFGNLTIDGITVSHLNRGTVGTGGYGVRNLASLTLRSGSISGNSGGGVANYGHDGYSASFTMSGGTIGENNGSGVFNSGRFVMTGGTITKNAARYGGAIHTFTHTGASDISAQGLTTLTAGTISSNTVVATNNGGVIYGGSGGAIYAEGSSEALAIDSYCPTHEAYPPVSSQAYYKNLLVADNMEFSGNKADSANMVTIKDTVNWGLYQANIHAGTWSDDMTVGYNNYDINYTNGYGAEGINVATATHVQAYGWQAPKPGDTINGTTGESKRMEAFVLTLQNTARNPGGNYSGTNKLGIEYASHVESIGWQDYVAGGEMSGTSGKSLRVEAIRVRLTGELASSYSVYYRVHAEDIGWTNWAKNGADAGSAGLSYRLEAMQIVITNASAAAPALNYEGATTVSGTPAMVDASVISKSQKYTAVVHVQNKGNVRTASAGGSTILGTSGEALRMEAVTLSGLSFEYESHVQDIGWQGYVPSGTLSGTTGQSKRVEAIRIRLAAGTQDAQNYDVYYRTHVQNVGWLGWAKNGQASGSTGCAYRMEALQIVVVPKNTTAPGLNKEYIYR